MSWARIVQRISLSIATGCRADDMRDFKELYYDWRAAKADACTEKWDEVTMRRHILEQVEPLAESLKEFIHMQRRIRDRGDARS